MTIPTCPRRTGRTRLVVGDGSGLFIVSRYSRTSRNPNYDDFSDSSCSLSRDGSPRFCEELAANVVGTSFLHENPGASENHYWVVACNRGGCSDIDSKKSAKPIETRPNGPAAAPTEKTSPLLKPTATESTPLVRDSL